MSDGWTAPKLYGAVAVVTGGSRGVGRGIALALGEAGVTVYVTGRSSRGGKSTEGLPGTVDETAEEVTRRGGTGIAVRCDHRADADTEALFARVAVEQDRLSLLVNNAWGGYERMTDVPFDAPFWEQPLWRFDLFAAALRTQFTASRLAVPLMIPHRRGLLVSIGFTDGDTYLGQVPYDVIKFAADRQSKVMAEDLRQWGIGSVALHPGFVLTERLEGLAVDRGPASMAHTPEYVGRAVVHLLADPDLLDYTGQVLATGDLARRYEFGDVDDRHPPPFRLEGRMTLATRMHLLNRSRPA